MNLGAGAVDEGGPETRQPAKAEIAMNHARHRHIVHQLDQAQHYSKQLLAPALRITCRKSLDR